MPAVTEEQQKSLAEQLDELGAQLDWVREYL
jgi:valyl-tRNA synthetase